jgi:hypothetical protein
LGGGTLAHLVHYHGATLIDWIEREAWRDVAFLEALSNARVAAESVHPTILIRLRTATGARIRIVRQPERDAAYKGMLERWTTKRPPRPDVRSPTRLAIPKDVARGAKVPVAVRFNDLLLRLQVGMAGKSRLMQQMVQGAVTVCLQLSFLTTVRARLLLPVLVLALCTTSASPITDLMLAALAFVLSTVGGAVVGLVAAVGRERRHLPGGMVYGVMTLIPYVTLIGLITRGEHGVIVAAAVLTGLVARPFVWRFFHRARGALRHVPGA